MAEAENIRPWGYYEVLEVLPTHQVKRLVINPSHRLSLQYHKIRTEHWVVVSGRGVLTLGDEEKKIGIGDYVCVHVGVKHRAECVSKEPLVIIETWTGDYFGEDDIVRLHDDYRRV